MERNQTFHVILNGSMSILMTIIRKMFGNTHYNRIDVINMIHISFMVIYRQQSSENSQFLKRVHVLIAS